MSYGKVITGPCSSDPPERCLTVSASRAMRAGRKSATSYDGPASTSPGSQDRYSTASSLSPRAARYLLSTAAMKPSGSTRLTIKALTFIRRNRLDKDRGV